ncbi:MAG: helix-turn-helix transcriptional regulator [Prosthecobacter sp.]|uniref:AraC family transcriptional regulator n=1 Tax=Prosthecobacter sp. TaxID=1965333 RepID=UPI002612FC91|nr:AraC family transcriptional regulator [Prosthecobacter sp.]MCF7788436.1 helix-turn-helix transcriptional regulator [Prosthecobacter sp.]
MSEAHAPTSRWHLWINRLLRRGWPRHVHLALETGDPASRGGLPVHASPRFSICLAGTGRYVILKQQRLEIITLQRGDAIVAAPHALMEPHPTARYLAIGFVFTLEMTRFLLAKKGRDGHRFLHTRHDARMLDEDGRHFFQALQNRRGSSSDDLAARRLVELLLIKTAEMSALPEPAVSTAGKARFTWLAACQFLQENLHHPIGRQDVADFLHLHPNHVSRLFRDFSGQSFLDHLLQARLERSRPLLQDPQLNITEIAHACGFRDANYFIRRYRRKFGESPGHARLSHFA